MVLLMIGGVATAAYAVWSMFDRWRKVDPAGSAQVARDLAQAADVVSATASGFRIVMNAVLGRPAAAPTMSAGTPGASYSAPTAGSQGGRFGGPAGLGSGLAT